MARTQVWTCPKCHMSTLVYVYGRASKREVARYTPVCEHCKRRKRD